MRTEQIYRSILHLVNRYKVALARYPALSFEQMPPMGGWSYSEVYCHIFDSSLLSVMAIQNCVRGEGELKPTHWLVKLILFFGMFPPGKKYQVPKRLATRVKMISLMAAQQLMTDFELQMAKVYPLVEGADPKIKVAHPRLGYLNAKQWLRFIEIHLKHHLQQLKRIENSFNTQS